MSVMAFAWQAKPLQKMQTERKQTAVNLAEFLVEKLYKGNLFKIKYFQDF